MKGRGERRREKGKEEKEREGMQRDKSRAKIRCVGGGEKKGVKERERCWSV